MYCWLISWWQQFFIYFLKLIYNIKSFFVIFLYVFVIILSIHLTSSFNVLSFTFSSIPSVSPLLPTEYFLFSRVSFIWQFNHNSNAPYQLKINALLESSHAVFILSALSKKGCSLSCRNRPWRWQTKQIRKSSLKEHSSLNTWGS